MKIILTYQGICNEMIFLTNWNKIPFKDEEETENETESDLERHARCDTE